MRFSDSSVLGRMLELAVVVLVACSGSPVGGQARVRGGRLTRVRYHLDNRRMTGLRRAQLALRRGVARGSTSRLDRPSPMLLHLGWCRGVLALYCTVISMRGGLHGSCSCISIAASRAGLHAARRSSSSMKPPGVDASLVRLT